ncbi:YjzD family protein [Bacillus seohaeanensis]|jgi:high-affinity Fe2+/Pb2+ permease|uniref:YjzD family protein n=1 Tax=Bacillus seohaeanensis TaxID=284580 RepID=A0ABW5RT68_9BACI
MRFFWTFFWTLLLTEMLNYVVSSMNGAAFHLETGIILAVVATILVFVVTLILPNEPVEDHN